MELEVYNTSEQQYVIEFDCNPYELDIKSEELSFDLNFHITCRIHKHADILRIHGEVHAPIFMQCARCLDELKEVVKGEFELVAQILKKGESIPTHIEDNNDDETRFIYLEYDKKTIDITDVVRDAFILSMPLKSVCKNDCKGLCSVCGHNLNEGKCNCISERIDSRWKKLAKISMNDK